MYIKKITINNYRNFDQFNMTFQDGLNVVVGPNNAGKTNLLRAIQLISNPDLIKIDDFNKNNILKHFSNLYKTEAPSIELEYQIHHEISEDNTEDESIIKLISFLGLDNIEHQKQNQAEDSKKRYTITGNVNMKYTINPKNVDKYLALVHNVDCYETFLDALKRSLKYYNWVFSNGTSPLSVDKKEVVNIFDIDFIEAERDNKAVYKETSRSISDFINSEENASSLQELQDGISLMMKTSIETVLSKISSVVEQENNEIGLAKGNVAIAQDIRPNALIQDSYVIDVKDTKSNYIIPLSHNGVGYNNLINMYMLLKLVEIRKGKDFRILCLEEPEAHLHPGMQYKLFSYLRKMNKENKLNQQIFVTTHSPNITAVAGLDNMYMLDYKREEKCIDVVSRSLKEQFSKDENAKNHMMKFLDVTRSDILFANKIILVEGIAEKLLMPKFMDILGHNYEDEHISIVEIGGKHFNHFLRIYADNPIDRKILCITDKDYKMLTEKKELRNVKEYKEYVPSHVKSLKCKFKPNKNISVVFQTEYGKTFEDELFLFNYDNSTIGLNMLEIVLSESLKNFADENKLDFEKWYENQEGIDGRSKERVSNLLTLFNNARLAYPDDSSLYEKLFFAKLFLTYAKNKKGELALSMLTDEKIMKHIKVPTYIEEGLEWLLK